MITALFNVAALPVLLAGVLALGWWLMPENRRRPR